MEVLCGSAPWSPFLFSIVISIGLVSFIYDAGKICTFYLKILAAYSVILFQLLPLVWYRRKTFLVWMPSLSSWLCQLVQVMLA